MSEERSIFGKHLRAWRHGFSSSVYLTYYEVQGSGQVMAGKKLVMEAVEEGEEYENFTLLPRTAAQELMDDLWQCGVRPSEGSGSAGSLAATERHLHDMRALVFKNKVEPKK
jgi:hypothetical protein